jgi:hypothetical protein
MSEVLYHYTSTLNLPLILKDGFLELTDSNLHGPKTEEKKYLLQRMMLIQQGLSSPDLYNAEYKARFPLFKPVVWLTDIANDPQVGLEVSTGGKGKKEIKISLKALPHYKAWTSWSRKQGIDKKFVYSLEKGQNPDSWYISTERISLTSNELLKIENTITGEVILDIDAGIREYICTVGPAGDWGPTKFYDEYLAEHGLKQGDTFTFSF